MSGAHIVAITCSSSGYLEEHFIQKGFNKVGKYCKGAGDNSMPPEELATLTALTLGCITCALVITAGVSLLGIGYTIAPRKVHKLKTRALKSLLEAAVTGATAVLISTAF